MPTFFKDDDSSDEHDDEQTEDERAEVEVVRYEPSLVEDQLARVMAICGRICNCSDVASQVSQRKELGVRFLTFSFAKLGFWDGSDLQCSHRNIVSESGRRFWTKFHGTKARFVQDILRTKIILRSTARRGNIIKGCPGVCCGDLTEGLKYARPDVWEESSIKLRFLIELDVFCCAVPYAHTDSSDTDDRLSGRSRPRKKPNNRRKTQLYIKRCNRYRMVALWVCAADDSTQCFFFL